MSKILAPALLHATRIWLDNDTKKEHQALVSVRWADVRRLEQDVNSGLDNWGYEGPLTYVLIGDYGMHLLGSYADFQQQWLAYTASAQALLLAHN